MCGDCSREARECTAALHGDRGTRPRQGIVRERKNGEVALEDAAWRLLRCDDGGTTWVPAMQPCVHRPGARFRGGYWWRPRGCHHPPMSLWCAMSSSERRAQGRSPCGVSPTM